MVTLEEFLEESNRGSPTHVSAIAHQETVVQGGTAGLAWLQQGIECHQPKGHCELVLRPQAAGAAFPLEAKPV